MKQIKLICKVCNKEFFRNKNEVKRNSQLGRRVYCSLSCVGHDNLSNLPENKRYHPENLKAGNRLDDFSPFRFHLKNARMHSKSRKKKEITVTLEDLKLQWEKQNGKCPYTGWKMDNPISTSTRLKKTLNPCRASLDRIDSSKGYTPDNIQFVSVMANYAKNKFSDVELFQFCEAVVSNRS